MSKETVELNHPESWPQLIINFGNCRFEDGEYIGARVQVQTADGIKGMTLNFTDYNLTLDQLDYKKVLELSEDCIRDIFRDSDSLTQIL